MTSCFNIARTATLPICGNPSISDSESVTVNKAGYRFTESLTFGSYGDVTFRVEGKANNAPDDEPSQVGRCRIATNRATIDDAVVSFIEDQNGKYGGPEDCAQALAFLDRIDAAAAAARASVLVRQAELTPAA